MSKKCTPLWREVHFQVKMYKAHQVRTTFLKLRCRKSVRRCGAKHISKSKCKNTRGSDHFWRFRCHFAWQAQGIVNLVKSEQNVRVLWHFQLQPLLHYTTLQQYITQHYNYSYNYTFTTFYYTTLHYTTLHYIPLHYTTLNYTTLHYTTFHYLPLHYTTIHCNTLHYTTFHYTTLHYLPLPSATFHYTPLHSTPLHYTE